MFLHIFQSTHQEDMKMLSRETFLAISMLLKHTVGFQAPQARKHAGPGRSRREQMRSTYIQLTTRKR